MMWHSSCLPMQLFSKAAYSGLLYGIKIPSCRQYSEVHRTLLQKVKRLTVSLQQKDWSSITSSTDKGGGDGEDKGGGNSEDKGGGGEWITKETEQMAGTNSITDKVVGNKLGSEIYFNKEVMRKIKKKQTEQYFVYTGNNYMEMEEAKVEYLLDEKDLEKLVKIRRKSPYSSRSPSNSAGEDFIEYVWTQDAEKFALEKWGTLEKLQRHKETRQHKGWSRYTSYKEDEKDKTMYEMMKVSFGEGSGAVVFVALMANFTNAIFKGAVWMLTGSPSIFSEFMHSIGDIMNQLFLAIGRYLSLKNPDASHPYGYRNHIHIWSILSGVVIFSVGCGFTLYHTLLGIMNPIIIDQSSLYLAVCVIMGTFCTESASLIYAIMEISKKAKAGSMSFYQYVKDGDDPLCNVVLLEDAAGVLGNIICGIAITASYALEMPMLDSIGSLSISVMLGAVSVFLFKTNADRLLGKALPYEAEITKYMESDRFINAVLDNKTLDFGDESRFKSEVIYDARLITRHFLHTEVDTDAMLVKWRTIKTTEDMEKFLEEFGAQVYDQIVEHVDRKEMDIKRKFPEIRHIDIEPS